MADYAKTSRYAAALMLAACMALEYPAARADEIQIAADQMPAGQDQNANTPRTGQSSAADATDGADAGHDDAPTVIDSRTLNSQPDEPAPDSAPDSDGDSSATAAPTQIAQGSRMSLRQKVAINKAKLSEINRQLGEDFLASYKEGQDVVSLQSGVLYKIIKPGEGINPTDDSVVMCRYRGTLVDGTEFDKTDARRPVALNVAGLLPGLREAVKLMSGGAKWQIVVPPQQAYGERGDRGIGPNAVLIYDMEILSVN